MSRQVVSSAHCLAQLTILKGVDCHEAEQTDPMSSDSRSVTLGTTQTQSRILTAVQHTVELTENCMAQKQNSDTSWLYLTHQKNSRNVSEVEAEHVLSGTKCW